MGREWGRKEERERVKERKGGVKGNTFSRKILSTMYSTYMITYLGHVKHKAGNTNHQLSGSLSFFQRENELPQVGFEPTQLYSLDWWSHHVTVHS